MGVLVWAKDQLARAMLSARKVREVRRVLID